MRCTLALAGMFWVGVAGWHGAVIGVSRPAESLTMARVKALPAGERGAWVAYVKR
jgi:hypothetical protein